MPDSIDDSIELGEEGEQVNSLNKRAAPLLEFYNAFCLGYYKSFANYVQRYTD